jgi:plastocyanin
VGAAPARAALPGAHISRVLPEVGYPGLQHLHYEFGLLSIAPGQNSIQTDLDTMRPQVPGFITRIRPNLVYAGSHQVPRVDVIHLHHGVWLSNGVPFFAVGEEKTILQLPQGYGLPYAPSDTWLLNYMIHDLTAAPAKVYITYDIDFVPAPASLTPVHPQWMDVAGFRLYPVFDALRGSGHHGRYTFPDDARGAARKAIGPAHRWNVPGDVTLVATAGHLHPGGLYNDLTATRAGQRRELFRSQAKYFEPAGAVSWDVAMTATGPDWRVALHAGDRVNLSTTYDTRRASWYESMGIDVVYYADGIQPGAVDPFSGHVDWHGELTHGHLAENRHHGGRRRHLPDARTLASGPFARRISIGGFVYGRGDFAAAGRAARPPVVQAGHSITFRNFDATRAISPQRSAYHTITACRAPCTSSTGIAYPLADAKVQFDSGELGYGGPPSADRNTWSTPKSLRPGTYTYFCRIHPFMRGSFRVVR